MIHETANRSSDRVEYFSSCTMLFAMFRAILSFESIARNRLDVKGIEVTSVTDIACNNLQDKGPNTRCSFLITGVDTPLFYYFARAHTNYTCDICMRAILVITVVTSNEITLFDLTLMFIVHSLGLQSCNSLLR